MQYLQGGTSLSLIRPLLGALLLASSLNATALPKHAPVPGGVAVVDLGPVGPVTPSVRWGEQSIAVVSDHGRCFALVGIPLDTLPGDFEIRVFFGLTVEARRIVVQLKNYPEQRLTIKDKRKVEPNPDDLARIEREKVTTDAIKRSFSAPAPQTDFRLKAGGPPE